MAPPRRTFDTSDELAIFIQGHIGQHVIQTSDTGMNTPGDAGMYYKTARAAAKTLLMTNPDGAPINYLDFELRQQGPLNKGYTRLTKAAAKAANEARFR